MTLSGGSGNDQARAAARAARQERESRYASRRPWQLPLIVGLAVTIILAAVVAVTVFGVGR